MQFSKEMGNRIIDGKLDMGLTHSESHELENALALSNGKPCS